MLKEMRGRNDLWNRFVEIERAYQEKIRQILALPEDPVAKVKKELVVLREEIKAARKRARSGRADTAALQARAKELRAQLSTLQQRAWEERQTLKEAARPLLERAEAERQAAVRRAMQESPLYWCNKEEVLATYERARRQALRRGTELKPHRWRGEGKVLVRYQRGLAPERLWGADSRLQIDPVPPEAWEHPRRSVRRRAARTRVRLRVNSQDHRPVWVELPMVMHRPIAPGSVIRSAAIIRRRVGFQYRHKLVITATLPQQRTAARRVGPAVAVDVGWRRVAEGLRVAYWVDELGHEGQLVLPEKLLNNFFRLDVLRSMREHCFNETRLELADRLAGRPVAGWLAEAAAGSDPWRCKEGLRALLRQWREKRAPNDEGMLAYLEEWCRRDRRLWHWEANLRDQAVRHRREIYRVFAATLARKYSRVFLEDFDLRRVERRPPPEEGTRGTIPPDRQRKIAALSVLRQAIETACRREGVNVVYVPPFYTTQTCHLCGRVEKFAAHRRLVQTCAACGALWDQDANAARVLLQRGLALERKGVPNED